VGPDPVLQQGRRAQLHNVQRARRGAAHQADVSRAVRQRAPLHRSGDRLYRVHGPKGDKTAHLFTRTDGKTIALAGLWDRWRSRDKAEKKETYTIVTTAPSVFAAQFHDRMPCVLELADVEAWLRASPEEAAALMRPAQDVLKERPLGKAINNVKNNAPELLAAVDR
jgi:putative SOS response-associated peptidase YedK